MKNINYTLAITLLILFCTSCYDREVIGSKEGVSIPTVTDLSYTKVSDNMVDLSWGIPTDVPSEIIRPMSVIVRFEVFDDDTLDNHSPTYKYRIENESVLPSEATTFEYTFNKPGAKYRALVKLKGTSKDEVLGTSNDIVSLGQSVDLQ